MVFRDTCGLVTAKCAPIMRAGLWSYTFYRYTASALQSVPVYYTRNTIRFLGVRTNGLSAKTVMQKRVYAYIYIYMCS